MAKSKKSTKKASVPKSLRKGSLPRPVDEVWAAGIGALGGGSIGALFLTAIASLLGWLIFGEAMTVVQIGAGAAILAGIALARRPATRKTSAQGM